MELFQKMQQLAHDVCVQWGLQSYSSSEVELDKGNGDSLPLQTDSLPSIAFLDTGMRLMGKMSGTM